jgi:hypothetical protein
VAVAAALVVRRRLPQLVGAPGVLAVGTAVTGGLVGVHLVPGLFGVLSRWTALAAAALVLIGAARVARVSGTRPDPPPSPAGDDRGGPFLWPIAAGALGALALWGVATTWNRTVLPPEGIDSITFHLPNVARWIQTGSFWQIDQFTPLLSNGHYPHNGDVVFLAFVLPWRNDALVPLVNPAFVALAGLSVYAIACELRVSRALAALAGATFVSLPVVGLNAYGEAMTDSMMLATFGTGVLFLLRHARNGRRSELVLAGVALGVSFGTKWYATTSVPALLAVWATASLLAGRPWRAVAAHGATLAGLVAVTGGFWLVRNLVESGNPVFPVNVALLGVTLFDAPRDFIRECAGFTIADYVGEPRAWREHILPAFSDNYGLPGIVLLAGFVAGMARALSPARGRRSPGTPLALAAGAAALAAVYATTPYSAFGPEGEPILAGASARYLVPALLLCAALGAWVTGTSRRLRVPVSLLALAAVVDGLIRGLTVPLSVVAQVAGVLAVAAGLAVAVVLATRRRGRRRALATRLAACALGVLVLVGAGHARQREWNERRYSDAEAPISFFAERAPAGHRVALVGTWSVEGLSPVLPAFGERLRNEVRFVGPTLDGQLREYDDSGAWERAIRDGGFDLVLVGRAAAAPRAPCVVPGLDSDDERFAREAGFQRIVASDRLSLWRVRGGSLKP